MEVIPSAPTSVAGLHWRGGAVAVVPWHGRLCHEWAGFYLVNVDVAATTHMFPIVAVKLPIAKFHHFRAGQ